MQSKVKFSELWVCRNCSYVGKSEAAGSGWIEIVLWCWLIIPGLIYSIWRRGRTSNNPCPECRSPHMMPASARASQEILRQVYTDEELDAFKKAETRETHFQKIKRYFMYGIYAVLLSLLLVLVVWGIVLTP